MIPEGQLYCQQCGHPHNQDELHAVHTSRMDFLICDRCLSDDLHDQTFWERKAKDYKPPRPCPWRQYDRVTLFGQSGTIIDIEPGGVLFRGDDHGSVSEGKRWNQCWVCYDQPTLKKLPKTIDWDAREYSTDNGTDVPRQLEMF